MRTIQKVTYKGQEWLVLDEREQDGKTLLISANIIDKQPYNADRYCSTWEESSLYGSLGDGCFLLSIEEVQRYFPSDIERAARYRGEPWAWWLRDIGIKNHAAFVAKDGSVNAHGYRVDCFWCGVRPAMWASSEMVKSQRSNDCQRD